LYQLIQIVINFIFFLNVFMEDVLQREMKLKVMVTFEFLMRIRLAQKFAARSMVGVLQRVS